MAAGISRKKYNRDDQRPAAPAPASKTAAHDLLERATLLAEPALAALGLELVLAQGPIEGGQPVLRLFIDRLPVQGEGGGEPSRVTLDDCAAASRAIDDLLEADDQPQPEGGYLLEVSSPGLDRPLVKEADYRRFAGRLVKIKLRRDGKTRAHKGRLSADENGGLALKTAEGELPFTFDEVTSGRLSLDEVDF